MHSEAFQSHRRLSHERTSTVSGPQDGHEGMGTDEHSAGERECGEAPLISICIPTYQGERFLAETVRSALAQDSDDFEVVVLDNASTDRTPEILDGFDDPRLVVQRNHETVDLPTNWRRVIEVSRGRYVKLLCADDLIHRSATRLQAAVLAEHPEVSVVASRRALINEDGRVLAHAMGLYGLLGPQTGRRIARRTVLGGGVNPVGEPAAVTFRRRDYDAVGGWDGSLVHPMDLDLWVRLLSRGSFIGQPDELAAFRVSPQALSAAHSPEQYQELGELVRRICADPAWGLPRRDRVLAEVSRKLTWTVLPVRQRWMRAGAVWPT
ncbi:glycosyltransferase [Allobranchiibius sp. GilTou38]|uniref:glycosyltransferase n=1 Tax=Allobranchiibius sp. GilTou38 TaxID=2815210 RepID=UPI001AA0CD46|nr:glycosyltransferase [Allobranchiibius sp. GilTou38]